jgi:hypothetical protein
LALSGCHREHSHGDADRDHGHSHNAGGSHSDSAESFSGATFKEGTGITLLDETRKSLGLHTVEVSEQRLPRETQFAVRVFGGAGGEGSEKGQLALGTVRTNVMALLCAGLAVSLKTSSGVTASGEVQRVSQLLASDEAEVLVTFRSHPPLKNGEFAEAAVSIPAEKGTLVIPGESVIRGAMGDLVYVVNGDAYLLTWVELGARSGGLVEVTDGLLAGDSVVTRGAMDLWLVELRAQKGGQGCCPAPPKKERK